MKTSPKLVIAVTASLIACLSGPASFAEASKAECTLLGNIARDGMLEVELGKLAEQKATNKEVKDFGKHMVTDHSNANEKLKAAAASEKITLPTELTAAQKAKQNKLSSLSGANFDQTYMKEMVLGHAKAITAVGKEARTGSGQTQNWAKETLPIIEGHKKDADAINAKLKS